MKRLAALLSGLCVVGAMLSATPATAADYVVSGAVTSDNGKVTSGEVHFFATCQDFEEFNPAASDSIDSGEYSVTVPPGKYRALIRPAVGTGALESWHSEKTSCAQATEVEVTGNTPLDLVALAGSNVTGTVASKNGDTESGAIYYFATCQDYRDETPAASASFTSHTYALTVPDGEYLVQILPERGTGALDSWHQAKTSCADADPVEVSGDTTVDLEAIAGSNVKGHVSSGHGTVTDGEVVFYTDCQAFEDDKPTANAYLSNGDYLTTVPDGEYLVRITPYDASGALQSWHSAKDSCDTADPVEVSGDTDADLVAVAGSQVSGTVTSSNGTVSGGSVEFYEDCAAFEDGQPSAGTTINTGTYTLFVADGTYLARILPDSGTGAVESWHSAEQSCDAAAVVTVEGTTPANLVALAGYPVSGSVSSSNGPVSTGYVHFFATCQDYDNHLAAASFEIANGTYSVDLPNGTYRVRIEPGDGEAALTSWHSARVFCEQADLVTVSGTTTADLIASPGSPVTGTVSSSRGPVNSARVQFYATCEDYEDHDIAAQDRVDGKQYQVTLPNGTYRVWIEPEPGETALESWHAAKPSCEQADVVTVTGAATVNLTASPGSVASGQVTSSRGPVDRGEVSFYASCQDAQPVGYAEIEAGQYAATLPDGPYRVRIHPYGATGAVDSWHDAKPTCDQAKVVNVTGDTAVDLVATAGSQVSGTVTRGSTPVGDGTVFFFAGCQDPNPTRVGIEAGTYEITVPDGTYRVLIAQYGSDGQTSSWHSAKTSCASADVVTVGGDTTADLVAAPTSKVAGQVTTDQGASVSSGNVYFYATCQDYADGNVTATSSLKRGSYTAALPDGSYRAFITPRTGAALSWHNAKATCVQADPITVSGATTADLVVATGAVVTGGVTSSNGVVLRGTVTFLNGCQRDNEKAVTRDAFAGSYTVNLLPGTYRVFINPDSGTGAKDSWHAAKPSCETADAVTVSGNATVDLVASAKGGSPPGPTPEPTTSPTPTPPPVTPVTQSVKKPPAKLKKGKKAALAKKTKQGAKVTWRSTTKKVCTVKKYTVKAKKKGTCKLSAKAPAIPGYAAFAKKFPIRVR